LTERKLKILLPVAILVIGAAAAVLMIRSRAPVATRPTAEYTPLVRVIEVRPRDYRFTVRAHGTVRPRTESALMSEVAGTVVEVAPVFAAGGFFEEGDVLVVIDPVDYELAVVTARGQVAQAKVLVQTEEAQAQVAREEWRDLGDGEAPPLAAREPQLEEARAALAAAEAALERAERDLARTRIRAPYDGRVRGKLVDVGQYVSPGTPLADIFAVDYAEVRLPIPDSDLAYLDIDVNYDARSAGGAVSAPDVLLSADFAGERRRWWGKIVRVEGEVDPVSRMINLVAQVRDPYWRRDGAAPLPAGLFVDAEIQGRKVEDVVTLPRSAMRGGDRVLVVDKEGRLRFRNVKVLRVDRSEAVIGGGLTSGELVCVSLLEAVTDGMKVRTVAMEGATGDEAGASEESVDETGVKVPETQRAGTGEEPGAEPGGAAGSPSPAGLDVPPAARDDTSSAEGTNR
jgi:multidrug efflux system membrane fusion protein